MNSSIKVWPEVHMMVINLPKHPWWELQYIAVAAPTDFQFWIFGIDSTSTGGNYSNGGGDFFRPNGRTKVTHPLGPCYEIRRYIGKRS